ncbi:hypothetical protein J3Q64DRAFT_1024807 [Phycomyces blakesleeanus]|uniref:Uncharacterized protein n=1 Tax=Phycomyces blakesleeanus TaxID=4837 RepID=A0ABR3BCG9_PHYBL
MNSFQPCFILQIHIICFISKVINLPLPIIVTISKKQIVQGGSDPDLYTRFCLVKYNMFPFFLVVCLKEAYLFDPKRDLCYLKFYILVSYIYIVLETL